MRIATSLACLIVLSVAAAAWGQNISAAPVDDWITTTGECAGTDRNAEDEAVAVALRKAVEQACGVFLTAHAKTEDYKGVYDKVFASAVGYVREYKVINISRAEGKTTAKVRARVSTQKFEEDWAVIAHTLAQVNNPRCMVSIVEATTFDASGTPIFKVEEGGIVQGLVEEFLLSKNIMLMDRQQSNSVAKRDVMLATVKDDTQEVAAVAARFRADVLIMGKATARRGKSIDVADQKMYQYVASLTIRVIQTDNAQVIDSHTYGPVTVTSLQSAGGEDKALAKLATDAAPDLLASIVQKWSKKVNVGRTVALSISGMDYDLWRTFKADAEGIQGLQALHMKEITEGVADIDCEYKFTNELLADRLSALKQVNLQVVEITGNRIKLKVRGVAPKAALMPAESTVPQRKSEVEAAKPQVIAPPVPPAQAAPTSSTAGGAE